MSVSGLESSEWGLVSLPHLFVCLVVSDVSVGSRALILCFAFQRSATLLLLWVQLFRLWLPGTPPGGSWVLLTRPRQCGAMWASPSFLLT